MEQITMSATIGKLAEALSKVQGEMGAAEKNADNPYFKSKYADLATCWGVAREPLSRNGLAVVQTTAQGLSETEIYVPLMLNGRPVLKDGLPVEVPRKQMVITVNTILMHTSGEWISSSMSMPLAKNDPQGVGTAVSYGRRYGLSAILGIVGKDEDDDANAASMPPQTAPARKAAAKAQAASAPQAAAKKAEGRARAEQSLKGMLLDDAGLGLKPAEVADWIRRTIGRDDIKGMDALTDAEVMKCITAAKAGIEARLG